MAIAAVAAMVWMLAVNAVAAASKSSLAAGCGRRPLVIVAPARVLVAVVACAVVSPCEGSIRVKRGDACRRAEQPGGDQACGEDVAAEERGED